MSTTKGGIMTTKANNKPDGVKSMKDLVVSMGTKYKRRYRRSSQVRDSPVWYLRR